MSGATTPQHTRAHPKRHKGLQQLLAEAEEVVVSLSPQQAMPLLMQVDHCFIDLREREELLQEGTIPGAIHCSRGLLEFQADPSCEDAHPSICSSGRLVLFCAGGLRSALAARTLHEMGFDNISHIRGGYNAWREQGGLTTSD